VSHILVIDDDFDIRECLSDVLSAAGYEVRTAQNGLEGLMALRAGDYSPCVVLLDLMMPVMSGQEFLEKVRAEKKLQNLPVVVVTAAGPTAKAPGANAMVRKPFEVDDLLGIVRTHCAPCA
jgi:two-component system chemotaxis response regulator CheY